MKSGECRDQSDSSLWTFSQTIKGKFHGRTELVEANGDVTEGNRNGDNWEGQGSFTTSNGDRLEGKFGANSKLNGEGYLIEDGKRYKVIIKDNKTEKRIDEKEQVVTTGDLTSETFRYSGEILDGKANGNGAMQW
eukprot:CAMPEP_0116880684 /NCGR_PEP_ID=MMETSP0463-20121206/12614_1 /TAXON_ID=181622 /ORGANISM="Strombidinopsis sp, Strain SopsisLIS2011" /LENGTH=134 /DNA_ID=CAMNT_0004531511 /DNA_START=1383 /DNA_END=1784 /DNA_ORIENTATION=-